MDRLAKMLARLAATTVIFGFAIVSVDGATTTATFDVQLIIQDDCDIVSVGTLDFGTQGFLSSNVDASSAINIQCTAGTSYDVGLNFGINGFRNLSDGANTINYDLYQNASYSTYWDDMPFGAVTATGTGTTQSFTVYGRVFAQTTPPPGTYTDTVTVTVSF